MENLSLPNEQDNKRENIQQFAQDFSFAGELLAIGVDATNAFCSEHTSKLELGPKIVVGGILAREIRRFRTIILVGQHGFVENAEILTRTLFEGVLGERFILQSPIPLDECSPQLQKRRRQLPPIPDGCSREEFHADLYSKRTAKCVLTCGLSSGFLRTRIWR